MTQSDPAASEEDPLIVAAKRWRTEFDQRAEDARVGLHHPLIHELILQMPPLHDSYEADAQIFAERFIVRLAEEGLTDGPLIQRLRALTCYPTREAFWAAADALKMTYNQRPISASSHLADAMARCQYYAAQKGSPEFACLVAVRALAYARYGSFLGVVRREFAQASLGWLLRAALEWPDIAERFVPQIERFGPQKGGAPASRAAELGRDVYDELVRLANAPTH